MQYRSDMQTTTSDISEGEFWCELAELLGHTTQGRDGIDAPLQMTRREALEVVRELLDGYDDLNASYGVSNERIAQLWRELEQAHHVIAMLESQISTCSALVKTLKDKANEDETQRKTSL